MREKRGADKIEHDYIVEGEKFDEIMLNLKVMARCSPKDKYLLVTGLIER